VPKQWQWTFRNAKGLTEADPWPNLVSRVEGKNLSKQCFALHHSELAPYIDLPLTARGRKLRFDGR